MIPTNSLAIVVYRGGDKSLAKFYASSSEENDSVQKHETTHPEPQNNLSDNDAISAIPVSYCLPDSIPVEEKKEGTLKIPTPNSRKRTLSLEKKYKDDWVIEAKQRKNGRWDKCYRHRETKFRCRSLKEVERYENSPKDRAKAKKKEKESAEEAVTTKNESESAEEAVTEMDAMKTEELIAMRRKEAEENRDYVEQFLADARYNLQRSGPYLDSQKQGQYSFSQRRA